MPEKHCRRPPEQRRRREIMKKEPEKPVLDVEEDAEEDAEEDVEEGMDRAEDMENSSPVSTLHRTTSWTWTCQTTFLSTLHRTTSWTWTCQTTFLSTLHRTWTCQNRLIKHPLRHHRCHRRPCRLYYLLMFLVPQEKLILMGSEHQRILHPEGSAWLFLLKRYGTV
jgi:hypothetical protein